MTIELNKQLSPFPHLLAHTQIRIKKWVELQRVRVAIAYERKQLSQLTPHQLRDIGIDKNTAYIESSRNFTDIPERRST